VSKLFAKTTEMQYTLFMYSLIYCWRIKELCIKLVFWKVYTMMHGQKSIKLLFCDVSQCRTIFSYWRFGITYRVPFSIVKKPKQLLGLPDPRRWDPIGCPETSTNDYHSTLRKVLGQPWYNLHRGGNLKQCKVIFRRFVIFWAYCIRCYSEKDNVRTCRDE